MTDETGHGTLPELVEGLIQASGVHPLPVEEEINVAGEPDVPIKDHSLAADDEIANPMTMQEPNELQNIGRKCGRVYGFR